MKNKNREFSRDSITGVNEPQEARRVRSTSNGESKRQAKERASDDETGAVVGEKVDQNPDDPRRKKELEKLENDIRQAEQDAKAAREGAEKNEGAVESANQRIAMNLYLIKRENLHKIAGFLSLEQYTQAKWGYSMVGVGEILAKGCLSPYGDIIKRFTSEAMVRPLFSLSEEYREKVYGKLATFLEWAGGVQLTPRHVKAAVSLCCHGDRRKTKAEKKFDDVMELTKRGR